ncbi:YolD-like family protein [Solibacillus sp. MA9]|uniref:YolD-like family protein n=1 Tax=Solibacillus palustris TaxID=2908203 RepID=A0ABS9UEL9_9BACL|nr:YolD-like family protein [Solibacillus sp. MA9]MCH7322418.1 YolD-like family protein [Solibacillus sp. MA9]
MIKNRGLAKKWTGMMIPEHLHQIKEWQNSVGNEYPKEKTDWEWDELQQIVVKAYHQKQQVELNLWRDKWIVEKGIITALHSGHNELLLDTEFSVKRIKYGEIEKVREIE